MKKVLFVFSLIAVFTLCSNNISFADGYYDIMATPYESTQNITPNTDDTNSLYFNNLVGYKINGLWGFYSKNDKSVNIPPSFTDVKVFNSDLIEVKKEGKWGLMDYRGNLVVKPLYDSIDSFSTGKFLVETNGLFGIITSDGNIIIPVSYQSIKPFNSNYIKVSKDSKVGLISVNDGKIVVPVAYDDILVMKKYYKVKSGGKWGIINDSQKIIVSASYDDIKYLNKKYFGVKNSKYWGIVSSQTGQVVVPVKYERVAINDSGEFRVRKNGKWETYNEQNENKKSDEIKSISPSSRVFINKDVYTRTYPSYYSHPNYNNRPSHRNHPRYRYYH